MRRGLIIGGAIVLVGGLLLLRYHHRGGATGFEAALAHLPAGYSATHGAISTNLVSGETKVANFVLRRGDTTVFTADSLIVSGLGAPDATGLPARIGHVTAGNASFLTYRHVDRLEIDQLNLHNLQSLFDPASYPNGAPISAQARPILANGELFGAIIHVDLPPQPHSDLSFLDFQVAHQRVNNLSMRLFTAPPGPEALTDTKFAVRLARAAVEEDSITENVSVDIPKAGILRIGNEKIHLYDGGKVQSANVNAISFTGSKAAVTAELASVEVTGIDTVKFLDQFAAGADAPSTVNSIRVATLDLRGLKIDAPKAALVTWDNLSFTNSYAADGTSSTQGSLQDLAILTAGRPLPPVVREGLKTFGMEDFHIDMKGHSQFDPRTGHLTSDQGDIVFHGLGTLHLTYDVDGIPITQQDPKNIVAAFRNATLVSAAAGWDDDSLTSRLFHLAAARVGKSETELRATLSLSLIALPALLPDQPDAADQINAFLDGRHTLTISLNPPTPVHLSDLNTTPTAAARAFAGGAYQRELMGGK
jgi:hypothetical protein